MDFRRDFHWQAAASRQEPPLGAEVVLGQAAESAFFVTEDGVVLVAERF